MFEIFLSFDSVGQNFSCDVLIYFSPAMLSKLLTSLLTAWRPPPRCLLKKFPISEKQGPWRSGSQEEIPKVRNDPWFLQGPGRGSPKPWFNSCSLHLMTSASYTDVSGLKKKKKELLVEVTYPLTWLSFLFLAKKKKKRLFQRISIRKHVT